MAIQDVTVTEITATPDLLLNHLVSIANRGTAEIGVTLHIGGILVSGVIIAGDKYFDTFGKNFGSALEGEAATVVEKSFAAWGDSYREDRAVDAPEREVPYTWIHLKDATYHMGNTILPTNGGVLWRGRLSDVSGWNLGNFTPERKE